MANEVKKVNAVAIADIKNINTITDSNLKKLNTLEFTGVTDALTLISTHTVPDDYSGSTTSVNITSGIDSTYDVYAFIFTNMHPSANGKNWEFQVSTGSGFDQLNITSTSFLTYHGEGGSGEMEYYASTDQAQGAADQKLTDYTGDDGDSSASGKMTLYAPSSGTYVKHFMATVVDMYSNTAISSWYTAGYINTTTAIDEISFKFEDVNIDAGVVKMYGLAKS